MARISVTASPYLMLTKPGIIMGNAITTVGGFLLASKGHFQPYLFLATLIGLSCIIGSACVFNNYIDREIDQKMARTKHRALASGLISGKNAIIFGIALFVLGISVLFFFTNGLALGVALFGFFVYVILYTLSKTRSKYSTLIGSFAGAAPPVVGYCSASRHFDTGALVFFSLLALWQLPHFLAIAIYRIEDYRAASIPVLPIEKGMKTTKVHMLLYIVAFMVVASMLTIYRYTGMLFLGTTLTLGTAWLLLGLKGLNAADDKLWARQMFFFSLIVIMGVSLIIPFSVVS